MKPELADAGSGMRLGVVFVVGPSMFLRVARTRKRRNFPEGEGENVECLGEGRRPACLYFSP
jgi:hypothetical protein